MPSSLNFPPYSDPPDSLPRWQPPPLKQTNFASSSYQSGAPVSSLGPGTSFSSSSAATHIGSNSGGFTGTETSWVLPYDRAAFFAYALGPFGAAILLVLEIENDFVRFHAWQSSLLSAILLAIDMIFIALGFRTFVYILVFVDVMILWLMALRAYRDSDLLDRFEFPFLGEIAQKWVQAE